MNKKIFVIVLLMVVSTFSFAGGSGKIDFLQLFPMQGPMFLRQGLLDNSGVLAFRTEPKENAELRKVMVDSFFSFDKNILQKINDKSWIKIGYFLGDDAYTGWIKADSLYAVERYDSVESHKLSLLYPYFLDAVSQDDGGLYVSYGVGLEHISGCDERDKPEVLTQRELFDMGFNVFDSLKEALMQDFSWYYENGKLDAELHYDESTDWFGPTGEYDFVTSMDYFGRDAYRIEIGAEGCGIDYYYYRQDNKVVVTSHYFDWNPPFDPSTGEPIEGSWTMPSENQIVNFLLNNLKIK